ncbi:MAG: DNA-directed DNA polymerase II small subunit [Haloarculaceae archaeon]
MPQETPARIARKLARRGYNADREAVTLLARAPDLDAAIEAATAAAPADSLTISSGHVRKALTEADAGRRGEEKLDVGDPAETAGASSPGTPARTSGERPARSPTGSPGDTPDRSPPVSGGGDSPAPGGDGGVVALETEGSAEKGIDPPPAVVHGDMTGASTGTGTYEDFVAVFRDRYRQLADMLRPRINHRPTDTIADMTGGSDAAIVGLVTDVRTTAGGHWLIELEDTTGTFPCLVMKDRDFAQRVRELLSDECIAVEGTLADDGGILFVDAMHFPDVPRTFEPSTADREVAAALVSDVHVGSQEFMADAWREFAEWLHSGEAAHVEYLLIAGDMVEGVGVYPGQDEELDIVDIYDQYREFSEYLKLVPGDMEIVMIPGNHDAVRLAEPQPGFDEELRDIMAAHDARIVSNPATVDLEGVSILMYHGVSLDEVIAELPDEAASYDEPHRAMYRLLQKRHVAPQYGGRTRLAPEAEDHLVIDEVPDVFHAGHVHKTGYGQYHNVLTINSGCWQAQTAFQRSVNIDPDAGRAPIVDLSTLDLKVRKFV